MSEIFTRSQLNEVAPWVATELKRTRNPAPRSEARPMHEWVQMVESKHSPLWHAVDAQG